MTSPRNEPSVLTSSGIPLKVVYGQDDVPAGLTSGWPGQRPFTRGAHAQMYRSKPWRIFQLSGFGNPEDEGARIRFLLEHGETGFIMEHDRNTADHGQRLYALLMLELWLRTSKARHN